MPQYPIEYAVALHKNDGAPMEVVAGLRPHLVVGPPPDGGGSDTWWSPQHLLVAALASSMTQTYFELAARANIHVGSCRCRARGTLDRREGDLSFVTMELALAIVVLADDIGRARQLVERAKEACFVAGSLRCRIDVTAEVTAS